MNIVRLKNRPVKVFEWRYGCSSVGASQPACWAYIPGPMTITLARYCGKTHRTRPMIGSIQNGIDHNARKMANSFNDVPKTCGPPRFFPKSFQRCIE